VPRHFERPTETRVCALAVSSALASAVSYGRFSASQCGAPRLRRCPVNSCLHLLAGLSKNKTGKLTNFGEPGMSEKGQTRERRCRNGQPQPRSEDAPPPRKGTLVAQRRFGHTGLIAPAGLDYRLHAKAGTTELDAYC